MNQGMYDTDASNAANNLGSSSFKALRPCGTLVAVGEVVANGLGNPGFQPTKVLV